MSLVSAPMLQRCTSPLILPSNCPPAHVSHSTWTQAMHEAFLWAVDQCGGPEECRPALASAGSCAWPQSLTGQRQGPAAVPACQRGTACSRPPGADPDLASSVRSF